MDTIISPIVLYDGTICNSKNCAAQSAVKIEQVIQKDADLGRSISTTILVVAFLIIIELDILRRNNTTPGQLNTFCKECLYLRQVIFQCTPTPDHLYDVKDTISPWSQICPSEITIKAFVLSKFR